MKKYELLIIIPARSGSKQIKNKNLAYINKHPLISYSIAAAKKINVKKKLLCAQQTLIRLKMLR